jgi:PPIC-type PPIASE domain
MPEDARAAHRARWLLLGGAAAGIALAAIGLVRGARLPGAGLAPDAIASVNGVAIRTEAFERLLAALASDKRSPVTAADRARVLERLVQEELLVQRGATIGLVESDPGVRKTLVQAVIDSVVAEAESQEPDPETLRGFYEAHRDYFGAGPRLRVERLTFHPGERGDPGRRAAEARASLAAGEGPESVRARLADDPVLPVPDVLLPAAKLREYLGADAVAALLAASDGAWSEPLETSEGVELVRVAARRGAAPPPLEAVKEQVAAEWRREQGDQALRDYLATLWAEGDVVLAPDAPR